MNVYKSPEGMKEIRDFCEGIFRKWPAAHERKEISAEGYRTNIMISGPEKSAPVILLHGTSSNSASWMGDVSRLSEKFRVFAVDIPGEPGLSDEMRIPFTDGGPAAWLGSVLNALDIESAHMVGMSLGGFYSLAFGTAHPERVRSLSLFAPSGLAGVKISFIFRAIPLSMMGDRGLRKINGIVSPEVDIPEEMFQFGRLTAKHFRPIMEAIPILTDEELGRLTMPVMYYGGTRDALLKTRPAAERLKKLVSAARINVIEGGGHTIIGKTEEVLRFIEEAEEKT